METNRPQKATNAESSGVALDKKVLKALMRRSDGPGLRYLGIWILLLSGSGVLLQASLSLGIWATVPAMLLCGTVLTVPAYALSHECSHGTAFKARWLNEAVLFLTSVIYLETPTFRRYAHARHHTYTWLRGLDAQMPFATPVTLRGWLLEISGLGQYLYDAKHMLRNALGRYDPEVRDFTPAGELPKLKWESRAFLAVYLGGAAATALSGVVWPILFLLLPRLAGGVVMELFTFIQHAEMAENNPDVRKSTRSFTTNRFARFLYANMSWHVEHHLYPTVPFHKLPALNAALRDQLPKPEHGLLRINAVILETVIKRAAGRKEKLGQQGLA